jgi:hypothetical protein
MMSDPTQNDSKQEQGEVAEKPAEPMTLKDLIQMAEDYHVPMTRKAVENIVGDEKEIPPAKAAAFEDYIKRQAQGLYPGMAPQIASGQKTSDLLEPYRQIGKQVLGDNFEPNFQTNPHDRAALQGAQDPTGHPTPMSLDQWQTHLKSDPAYDYANTDKGKAETQDVKNRILAGLQSHGS